MDRSPEAVWQECLEFIRDNINRQSFKTWFEPLKAISLSEEGGQPRLTVQLPSQFYYEWLEEHYLSLIRKTITRVLGPDGRLFYNVVIENDDADQGREGTSMQLPAHPPNLGADQAGGVQLFQRPNQAPSSYGRPADPIHLQRPTNVPVNPLVIPGLRKVEVDSQLNASYSFDRFIEGDCNRLARSAAWAISQQPGSTSFNPFLIYGGVGLGKTHLIQAVGNYVLKNHKAETVLYVSSERFTNEFVQSIQNNRISDFSMFYRQIDLLIVDDIQFFGGKEKTQEEFFHIFNDLHQSGKQIILSADRPPREIKGIEERLLSRFQWGLMADVQMPDLETRIAILQRKMEDDGITLPEDVIEFIAHNVKSNIRELEGALIRLMAYSTLRSKEVDLGLAKEVLKDLMRDSQVNLTIEEIQRIVCTYFQIPQDLVCAKTRKREVVQARQVSMFFCKEFTKHSLKTIGLHFGGRDHSTVIHANQTVMNQMETDQKFNETVENIRHKITMFAR